MVFVDDIFVGEIYRIITTMEYEYEVFILCVFFCMICITLIKIGYLLWNMKVVIVFLCFDVKIVNPKSLG